MDLIKSRTKPLVGMSYRSVGSGVGQSDFSNEKGNFTTSANDFGCGDFPMPSGPWRSITASGNGMLHVPYLVGTVSFFHNVPGVVASVSAGGQPACGLPGAGCWVCWMMPLI